MHFNYASDDDSGRLDKQSDYAFYPTSVSSKKGQIGLLAHVSPTFPNKDKRGLHGILQGSYQLKSYLSWAGLLCLSK